MCVYLGLLPIDYHVWPAVIESYRRNVGLPEGFLWKRRGVRHRRFSTCRCRHYIFTTDRGGFALLKKSPLARSSVLTSVYRFTMSTVRAVSPKVATQLPIAFPSHTSTPPGAVP